jgi:nitrogenase molybdenum-iron protein beta chain
MSTIIELPRGTCVLGGVNAVLSAVNRFCPIFHSGPGCCMQTSAGESGQAGLKSATFVSSVSLPCSNMLEREIIFGGEKKLREEIDGSLEIIDADAFFILTGCTAGIIGDDVENVARDYQARGFPVYPIPTPGFVGDSFLGFETAFKTFTDHIIEKTPDTIPNLVNLLGIMPYHDPHWLGSLEELARILRSLGLEVNTFFSEKQGLANIRSAGRAALNIIVNPWLLKDFSTTMEEKFGVRSIRFPGVPIGATQTSSFVRAVGRVLELDPSLVEKVIMEEESYVYGYYETIIGGLSWKKFAVASESGTAIAITKFLADDFSMTPAVAIVTEPVWRPADREYISGNIRSLEYADPPDVFFLPDYFEITRKIKEYDGITLLIGSSLERELAMELGIQCHVMSFPVTDALVLNRTYAGYRGGLTIVEDLFNNL